MRSLELSLNKYDSDKINSRYLEQYDPIFAPYINNKISLLELGVLKGGSLLLWRDYFPEGTIAGIDMKLPKDLLVCGDILYSGSEISKKEYERLTQYKELLSLNSKHIKTIKKLLYIPELYGNVFYERKGEFISLLQKL